MSGLDNGFPYGFPLSFHFVYETKVKQCIVYKCLKYDIILQAHTRLHYISIQFNSNLESTLTFHIMKVKVM